jgi:TolB-like protein
MKRIVTLALAVGLTAAPLLYAADNTAQPAKVAATNMAAAVPAAILSFSERGAAVKGYAEKVADLLFAKLSTDPDLWLVDRQELDKVLSEHELSASGMVNPAQAVKIGSLTGAKILITGSVMDIDKDLYIVAKIIGTETTRVLGSSVKGSQRDDLAPLVGQLAAEIAKTVKQQSDKLVAPDIKLEDRIAALKKTMGDKKRPSVAVHIPERHVGQATIDPAAATEVTLFCKETGFEVFDTTDAEKADVKLEGEGFSEFGMRRGNLVSVKARVELKAVDRKTGQVLATDRETAVEVDLTELIAGKKALQSAAARIAERMLPKLVK